MFRQGTSRNQRSKGFTVKKALQFCLLVIVCVWIPYQIMHSHDKRKAYEERGSNVTFERQSHRGAKFHKKDLPDTSKSETATKTMIEGRRKEGDGDVAQEFKHKQVGNRGEKSSRTKELRVVDNQKYEDASHEARENSFKGDDASSEVVNTATEVEHEVSAREAREGSTKDGYVSRSVDHVTGSEGAGIRNFDEKLTESALRKDGDNGVVSETLENFKGYNSSAFPGISEANNTDAVLKGNQTLPITFSKPESVLGILIAENRFQANVTRNESDTHMEQQSGLATANVIDDKTELKLSLKNVTVGGRLPMNLTASNFTSVSYNKSDAWANLTDVKKATNFVPLQSGEAVLQSVQGQNNTVEAGTTRRKSSIEYGQMERSEKSNTTSIPKSSKTDSATDDKAKVFPVESDDTSPMVDVEDKKDALTDLVNSQDKTVASRM